MNRRCRIMTATEKQTCRFPTFDGVCYLLRSTEGFLAVRVVWRPIFPAEFFSSLGYFKFKIRKRLCRYRRAFYMTSSFESVSGGFMLRRKTKPKREYTANRNFYAKDFISFVPCFKIFNSITSTPFQNATSFRFLSCLYRLIKPAASLFVLPPRRHHNNSPCPSAAIVCVSLGAKNSLFTIFGKIWFLPTADVICAKKCPEPLSLYGRIQNTRDRNLNSVFSRLIFIHLQKMSFQFVNRARHDFGFDFLIGFLHLLLSAFDAEGL